MASIRERVSTSGERTWAVLYRRGRKQTSQTFASEKRAGEFKSLVEILGAERAEATLALDAEVGITLDELADQWLAWKARDVTERTAHTYRMDYDNYIRPRLGHRIAESIDERDVQQFVDAMAERLAPKSVADRHMILHGIYKYGTAKSRQLVTHNPCLETQLPKRQKKPPKGVTLAEWYALYDAAQRVDPDAADLIVFIAATGWRWSEAAALTVGDAEEYPDAEGVMRMSVTMRGVQRGGRRIEGAAKSDAGFRRVKLPRAAADVVRRRSVGKGPHALVFTNARGGQWYQPNFLSRTWTDIVAASGLDRRPTPHMLRHAHVALLNRTGVSLAEMQRRLGHEDIQTTINVYGGMIDDISGEALDALDLLLTRPVSGQVVQGETVVGELSQ
jgi:integrase